MLNPPDRPSGMTADDNAFLLLQELEKNTSDELRRQRATFRLALKAAIVVQPGNASELLNLKLRGTTGDISEGGLSAMFSLPVRVGDIYRLQVDPKALNLPLLFARCVRCRLIREDAYESGFAFFDAITLPESAMAGAGSSQRAGSRPGDERNP